MHSGTVGRSAAGCIAAIAWLGLAFQCISTFQINHSVPLTLWIVFAYFTILTNLLVALVFTGLAISRTKMRASWIVAGTMLSILLVGIIYALLLHGKTELSGGSAVANALLHMAQRSAYVVTSTRLGNLPARLPCLLPDPRSSNRQVSLPIPRSRSRRLATNHAQQSCDRRCLPNLQLCPRDIGSSSCSETHFKTEIVLNLISQLDLRLFQDPAGFDGVIRVKRSGFSKPLQ
jgi:hypothetical protein